MVSLNLIFAFIWHTQQRQFIDLPSKKVNIETLKDRYFMAGYSTGNNTGNIYWQSDDGTIPKTKEIMNYLHKSDKLVPFKSSDFVIVGIYEFKNKQEKDLFISH